MQIKIHNSIYSIVPDNDYLANCEEFEPDTVGLLTSITRPSDVAVDVGANIGCVSLLLGSVCNEVHAFEPSLTTYSFLEQNIFNSSALNIKTYNMGIGSEDKISTLTYAPQNSAGAFVSDIFSDNINHVTEHIHIKRLDDVVYNSLPRVDFLKIDTEGYELNVLEGAKSLLQRDSPIVYLEMNHWCLNAFQRISIPDFIDRILEMFEVAYAIDGYTLLDLNDPISRYKATYEHILHWKYNNILCGPASKLTDRLDLDRFQIISHH